VCKLEHSEIQIAIKRSELEERSKRRMRKGANGSGPKWPAR
jgi:hypothetical protein